MGFTMMTVCLIVLAVAYEQLRKNAVWAFIAIYSLMFLFANFGKGGRLCRGCTSCCLLPW